mgnify:FL=1
MNRVVVISGATSGIGKALAKKFEADGDIVCKLSRSCTDNGFDYKCDVSDEAQVNAAVGKIGERYGRVDILVNNAGIGISGATELIPMDDIKKAMDISYFGALYLTRACLKFMKKGARIIFMSSIAGLTAIPFRSVYCSVKAAELMLGESLRMELSQTGISVVTLCPGEIKTNFSANKLADVKTSERYGKRVEKALEKVTSREEKRMSIASVIDKIYKICVSGRKAMYIIGGKYKFLYFAKRVLPTTTYLKLTDSMLGGRE